LKRYVMIAAVSAALVIGAPMLRQSVTGQEPTLWETGTFSILGFDPATGEVGGAVQSRVFSVGNGVLWADADAGMAAPHGGELPFVFDHPDRIGFLTGTGQDRYALASNMSAAWVAFARTGNPNHGGIPRWDAWTPSRWATMVFDTPITAVDDPWGDERRAMARA